MVQTHPLLSVTEWFDAIENGTKTVEGRLLFKVEVGDLLEFTCMNRHVVRRVTFVHEYSCFAEMLDIEGVDKIMPGIQTQYEASQIFGGWYKIAVQRQKGVC